MHESLNPKTCRNPQSIMQRSISTSASSAPRNRAPATDPRQLRRPRRQPAPRQASRHANPTHYGQNAMLIGAVVTLIALLVLALPSRPRRLRLLESLLFAQFRRSRPWLHGLRYGLR